MTMTLSKGVQSKTIVPQSLLLEIIILACILRETNTFQFDRSLKHTHHDLRNRLARNVNACLNNPNHNPYSYPRSNPNPQS